MDSQNPAEEDVDAFLYGPTEPTPSSTDPNPPKVPQPEDEEEDDDDVEIVLSASNSTASSNPNALSDAGGFLKMSAKQNQDPSSSGPNSANASSHHGQSGRIGGVDLGSIATLDGQSLLDVDIEGFEEKPWRKPGADITDYFNFGFNELTWKQYCYKQKNLREEFSKASGPIFAGGGGSSGAPSAHQQQQSNSLPPPPAVNRPRDKMYSSRRYPSRSRSPASGKRMRGEEDRDRRRGGRY